MNIYCSIFLFISTLDRVAQCKLTTHNFFTLCFVTEIFAFKSYLPVDFELCSGDSSLHSCVHLSVLNICCRQLINLSSHIYRNLYNVTKYEFYNILITCILKQYKYNILTYVRLSFILISNTRSQTLTTKYHVIFSSLFLFYYVVLNE